MKFKDMNGKVEEIKFHVTLSYRQIRNLLEWLEYQDEPSFIDMEEVLKTADSVGDNIL